MTTLKGFITDFDGLHIKGWLQGATAVDLYINDMQAGSFNGEEDAQKNTATFDIDIKNFISECRETPKIAVKFAKTDIELEVAEPIKGLINPVELFIDPMLAYFGSQIGVPVPPQEYIEYIGSGAAGKKGFLEIGVHILRDLVYFGVLNDSSRTIVDIGCGCGRAAMALGPYLRPHDEYRGFDTWRDGIEWAAANLSNLYPALKFFVLPQINQGRRKGYQADQVFTLDLPDGWASGVLATSLFTHLHLQACEDYLKEVYRVLKPGARAFTTFFFAFPGHELPKTAKIERNEHGYFIVDESYVDAFFHENVIIDLVQKIGFRLAVKRYGYWGNRPRNRFSRQGQDLLILIKPS